MKKKLLFICVGNSCRSQMAEAIARDMGYEVESAGTKPAEMVHPNTIKVLKMKNIDVDDLKPKHIDSIEITEKMTVISMGCGVECPNIKIDKDLGLEDPEKMEDYIETAEEIENFLKGL
ncbi:MAG: hypothetical protein BEU04_03595 [Marine Group III euryarchaeote CG-Bathy1]|uniref:Phosphotyrosine protein phosphatase I domain-containing protein n=1 Tax=Marine Group III euryarchaeote CG-Bathy1 TaxID=1889001 RepID=A0A1J5TBN8_9ARCH|nr:MAG: hypothetical protein BEU04_03595 [Marine Group III euryarchaeote CG-Bathy1]